MNKELDWDALQEALSRYSRTELRGFFRTLAEIRRLPEVGDDL